MKITKVLTTLAVALVVLFQGCKKDDYKENPGLCPLVVSTDPVNLATGVPLNKVVTATFNENMNPLTVTAASFTLESGAKGMAAVTGVVSCSGAVVTFTPAGSLLANTTYTGTLKNTIKDLNGNSLQNDYIWTFKTAIVPTVTTVDPLNLAINVALNKVISATFSEAMDPLTINTTNFTLMNGAIPVPGTVVYSGTTATFTPGSPLILGKTYTATILTGARSVPGIPLASNYVWTFSTGASIAPTVISTDPLNLAANVVLNKIITANFSMAMNPLTITATTFKLMDGLTPVAGVVTYSGTTGTFTPSGPLLSGKTYTATITTGVQNVAGTAMANNYVWAFSTGAVVAPTVILVDPDVAETGVPLNKVLTATFSTAMDPLTLTTSTFTLMNGAIPVTGAVNPSGSTVTFTPASALLEGRTYTATITTGARNVAGTALVNNYVWTFTTLAVPPTVTSTVPVSNAPNVALNSPVTATFSVPMDGTTLTALTFTLKIGATPVAGAVTYSGSTATFTPSALLLSDATYTATITTGAKNVAGTSLASNYVWTFNTVPHLGPLAPVLGGVARFGIIAGVGVSNNAGPSEIHDQDVGIYPGARTSITGFLAVDGGPGLIFNGAFYASDDIAPPGTAAMLLAAKNDLTTAYNFAAGATVPAPQAAPADLGGKTLAPGIWTSATTMLLQAGNLTLDAQGDVNAVWIFQVGSAFTSIGSGPYPSASGGNVILAGGAQAKNIFWQVGSSAVIGDYTSFYGTVMAFSSITMNTGSTVTGRMLARNASVVLTSTNIINKP